MKELGPDGRIRFIAGLGCVALAPDGVGTLIGTAWIDLWPRESRPMIARALERACAGERVDFVSARPTSAGASRWWEVMIAPVIAGDALDHLLVISRDVTERVQLQNALESINELLQDRLNETVARSANASTLYGTLMERLETEHGARRDAENRLESISGQLEMAERGRDLAQASAQQAQKQQAIGQLVSGIAHDFSNMLQTVIVSLSGLEEESDAWPARQKRMLTYAVEGARHATALTRRLLAFARNQQARPEPIDLGALVTTFADFARHGMGGRVGIDVVCEPGPLPAWVDRHGLEQALMNVCLNARDAMDGRGSIAIEVGQRTADAGEGDPLRERGVARHVFICVADTGAGMDDDVRQRLFEPYFTTKEGGSGLGLAQVYGTVAQAGGTIEVQSETGKGTRISLIFPRYPGPLTSEDDSV